MINRFDQVTANTLYNRSLIRVHARFAPIDVVKPSAPKLLDLLLRAGANLDKAFCVPRRSSKDLKTHQVKPASSREYIDGRTAVSHHQLDGLRRPLTHDADPFVQPVGRVHLRATRPTCQCCKIVSVSVKNFWIGEIPFFLSATRMSAYPLPLI
jgi:hypothetical protein